MKKIVGSGIAGFGAGALNGLFGAGGGMVLIPLLSMLTDLEDEKLFGTSVTVLMSICIVSLLFSPGWSSFHLSLALPYLTGSVIGGILAGFLDKKIPSIWLHRVLGVLILWGGIRYLCL